jgi:nucleoid-associated protein YgaU
MTTRLLIDDFEFIGFEVPDVISFGGNQSLALHKLPGGVRVIDSIGRDDAPLEWDGIFTGGEALNRARYLDRFRIQGDIRTLTWGAFRYSIVIREFRAKYERSQHIPYKICCEIIEDLTTPVTSVAASKDIDSAIGDDTAAAQEAAAALQPSTVFSVEQVQTQVDECLGVYAAVTRGIASVVNLETSAIALIRGSIDSALIFVTGCKALLLNSVLQLSALFTSSLETADLLGKWATDSANLHELNRIEAALTTASRNLGYINGYPNAKQVTVAGGSLLDLALEYYGDATQWQKIADANNMTDTVIAGVQTITIPAAATTPANISGGWDIDHWVGDDIALDNHNDLATADSGAKAKQRILRRLLTNPGSYKWHPAYGAGVLQHVGDTDRNLKAIEGLIISQVHMGQGVAQTPPATVTFDISGDTVTANIQYTDQESNSRQFISFTVTA